MEINNYINNLTDEQLTQIILSLNVNGEPIVPSDFVNGGVKTCINRLRDSINVLHLTQANGQTSNINWQIFFDDCTISAIMQNWSTTKKYSRFKYSNLFANQIAEVVSQKPNFLRKSLFRRISVLSDEIKRTKELKQKLEKRLTTYLTIKEQSDCIGQISYLTEVLKEMEENYKALKQELLQLRASEAGTEE